MNIFRTLSYLSLLGLTFLTASCKDEVKDALVPYPEDITFNEIILERFSSRIPDAPFRSGATSTGFVQINIQKKGATDFSGFALSNKNYRSYPWILSPDFRPSTGVSADLKRSAIDSTVFSVYTTTPNRTETYLIGHAKDDQAFLSFDDAVAPQHVLIANTAYTYLLANYGSNYSGTLDPATQQYKLDGTKVRNPNISSTSTADYGRWYLPTLAGKDLTRIAGYTALSKTPTYIRLLITGYLKGSLTGTTTFYLGTTKGGDIQNPTVETIRSNWTKVDLQPLGRVDKILFTIDGNYRDAEQTLLSPAYFALDGLRIQH
ncbi:DUF4465 domain-containing protein [Sphingobacterium sp. MYb388]|uniref:DUF4465 domain-containing protein n=1 Tax=Sphingobacterium sp. MYb388 TaxID=2745437 RepID=UPI00309DF92B